MRRQLSRRSSSSSSSYSGEEKQLNKVIFKRSTSNISSSSEKSFPSTKDEVVLDSSAPLMDGKTMDECQFIWLRKKEIERVARMRVSRRNLSFEDETFGELITK
jgi:hypothetical protein